MSNQFEGCPVPKLKMEGIKMTVSETDFIEYLKNLHYRADAEDRLYLQIQVQGRLKWMLITIKVVYAVLSNDLTQHTSPMHLHSLQAQLNEHGWYLHHHS